ncbi:MAG: hypothetical protein ACLQJR_10300 [Stellaceae bacterium]
MQTPSSSACPSAAEPSLHDLREWLERARQFRGRIQELRALAETIADPDTKSGVLAAAENYARLADELGKICGAYSRSGLAHHRPRLVPRQQDQATLAAAGAAQLPPRVTQGPTAELAEGR